MVNAFIPLRSGSKSIKDKNIKLFNGYPLCYWVLKACQESKLVDNIIVAIDSDRYKQVILNFQFNKVIFYERLNKNSDDFSTSESVILEYLDSTNLPLDSTFLLVQATSPHLKTKELDEMLSYSLSDSCDIVSCVRLKRFLWNKNGKSLNYDLNDRPRRQDFEGILIENGAVYISSVEKILRSNCRVSGQIKTYEMNDNSFYEIDEENDFRVSEMLMKPNN